MGFEELLVDKEKFSSDIVLDLQDFITYFRRVIRKRGYEQIEKVQDNKISPEGLKTVLLQWQCNKEFDDYHEGKITFKILLLNAKEKKSKEKIVEGNLSLEVKAILESDRKDIWSNKSWIIFLRHFFDKFIQSERKSSLQKELKEDVSYFLESVKRYVSS